MAMIEKINYPFEVGRVDKEVLTARNTQIERYVRFKNLEPSQALVLSMSLRAHNLAARKPFALERDARRSGETYANLVYHHEGHMDQTGYDTLVIINHWHEVKSPILNRLTTNGEVASQIAADNHDREYAESIYFLDNYAQRKEIHVAGSRVRGMRAVLEIGLPNFLDPEWVSELVNIGIHATKFPFKEEDQAELDYRLKGLTKKRRAEADIVWRLVRFADLGGQLARVDYLSTIWDLETEENFIAPNQGTSLVGKDEEKMASVLKFFGYVKDVYLKDIGILLFGTEDHPYAQAWREHMDTARSLVGHPNPRLALAQLQGYPMLGSNPPFNFAQG